MESFARSNRTALTWVNGTLALRRGSHLFRHHRDRATGALRRADTTAFAVIVIEFEPVDRPELDHRVVRADAVAIVTLEAIAAGKAPPRFIERVGLVESALHLLEGVLSPRDFQHWPHRLWRVGVVPGIELVVARDFARGLCRQHVSAQPCVDIARRLLSVAYRDRDGALGGHHVAAGEDAGVAGHHVGPDLHHAVLDLEPWHAIEQRQIDVLPKREHERIRL